MSTTLKRRLKIVEMAARKRIGPMVGTSMLIEPVADVSEEHWQQFAIRKAEAEASGQTIVVIRSVRPVRPIDYLGRVVIVPPKIPALRETRPLPMEGNTHAH